MSQFLDHSSLAVTTVYRRRLEGQAVLSGAQDEVQIGLDTHVTLRGEPGKVKELLRCFELTGF